ncbi:MAG TPA: hypothetical protein PKG52_02460 [bacterium]|nr:hypothetical protein [bacterium]HPS30606.1 hypothetical protein [bacterium]
MKKLLINMVFMILMVFVSCEKSQNKFIIDLEVMEDIDFNDDLFVESDFNENKNDIYPDADSDSSVDVDSGVDEDIETDPCIGDLEITTGTELEAILHCTEITGYLSFSDSDLEEISMPNLVSVKSLTISQNSLLRSVSFPVLQEMDGSLFLEENYKLLSFSLPDLKTALFIKIESNHVLSEINLNAVDNAVAIRIVNNQIIRIS